MKKWLSICTLILTFLAGCTSEPLPKTDIFDPQQVATRHKIIKQYKKWAGTPYHFGGMTKKGVDCSAFVKNMYQDTFNQTLPRTTGQQQKVGKAIAKAEMKVGDLIFFKRPAHVGIYIGNGEFIHASTSKGVTTSHLKETYYRTHYETARRVR